MQARPDLFGMKWSKFVQKVGSSYKTMVLYKCNKGLRRSGKTFVHTKEMSDFIF